MQPLQTTETHQVKISEVYSGNITKQYKNHSNDSRQTIQNRTHLATTNKLRLNPLKQKQPKNPKQLVEIPYKKTAGFPVSMQHKPTQTTQHNQLHNQPNHSNSFPTDPTNQTDMVQNHRNSKPKADRVSGLDIV